MKSFRFGAYKRKASDHIVFAIDISTSWYGGKPPSIAHVVYIIKPFALFDTPGHVATYEMEIGKFLNEFERAKIEVGYEEITIEESEGGE